MTSRPLAHALCPKAVVLLAALCLGACNLPSQGTPLPPPEGPTPSPPAPCTPDAPGILAAAGPVIHETLRPVLAWVYDGECPAEGFNVQVGPGGDFDAPGALSGTTGPGVLNWAPEVDLAPVSRYEWRVAALAGGIQGPYSVSRSFWTGPTCDGTNLQPPTLVTPADGAFVNVPSPLLAWEYPDTGCLQAWYSLAVSASPDFAVEALRATVGPEPSFETLVPFLEDCTLYHWRVKAVYGEDISGPYSAVGTFYTDLVGSCGAHTAVPRIAGTVWLDVCPAAGPPGRVTPPGCVYQEGGYAPDGIRQAEESPLPGLIVSYSPGGCPPAGTVYAVSALTDAAGAYSQYVAPGDYCVRIDAAQPDNAAILGRGRWSYPPGGYDFPVQHSLTLGWGEQVTDVDFGWFSRR